MIILIKKNVLDWQSIKKLIHLKYVILETPYTFFSIYSYYFSFTHIEHPIQGLL